MRPPPQPLQTARVSSRYRMQTLALLGSPPHLTEQMVQPIDSLHHLKGVYKILHRFNLFAG